MTMLACQHCATASNGRAIPREAVPLLSPDLFRRTILDAVAEGQRVVSMFALPEAGAAWPRVHRLFVVLADDRQAVLHIATMHIENGRFASLTPECPQVHLFERELAETHGLIPEGHPWLKPVRFPQRPPAGAPATPRPQIGIMDFYQVAGDQVHEVSVGPVHAGIIEPGHFRFQCHGEQVFFLEISLGYQHRGVERALAGGPDKRSLHYAQTLAGDTTVGHATAYCLVIEALADCRKTARAQALRGIALELERLANHVGDLGAMAGDTGYLPTSSFCGRIRGDFLNMTAALCGSRFGRSMVRPGGVTYDVSQATIDTLCRQLDAAHRDCKNAINLLWDAPSVMARFEDIGIISRAHAELLGLVGPPARACGLTRDARQNHPSGIFRFTQIPISTSDTGDVFARAYVRWLEIQRSLAFLKEQLPILPGGQVTAPIGEPAPNRLAIALVEGWRGELCHVALTDAAGKFETYKVVDPSFHNWPVLAYALRNQQISDFPLCNKSFNLSYCGHDL